MPKVITAVGYEIEDDGNLVRQGDYVVVPIPEVENPEPMPEKALYFLAQLYGMKLKKGMAAPTTYGAHPKLERLPEAVMNIPTEQVRKFIVRLFSMGGTLYKHYSTTRRDSPEAWIRCHSEEMAWQLQYLLLRLSIRSRVFYLKQRKSWFIKTSGTWAWMRFLPLVKATRRPDFKSKADELNLLIEEEWRAYMDHGLVKDKVVEEVRG